MLLCSVDIFPSAVARSVSKIETELVFVLISTVFVEILAALDEILLELVDTVLCRDETLLELLDTVLCSEDILLELLVAVP